MKKYLIVIVSLVFAWSAQAQSFVENNFEELLEADHTTVVKVSESMFKYASILAEGVEVDDEDLNIKELVGGIRSLHLVAAEDFDGSRAEYKKGLAKIGAQYDELVTVKSKEGNFGVYIDEEDDVVYEVIAIGAEDDDFFVCSVLCEIRLEDLSGIMAKMQSEDWKPFKKMSDLDLDELKVYPNPVSASSGISLEVPKALVGGEALLVNGSGATMKTYTINTTSEILDVDGLTPGYYVLSVNNAGVTMKKKVLVVE